VAGGICPRLVHECRVDQRPNCTRKMRRGVLRPTTAGTSIAPKASRVDPILGCDIGTRSLDLDTLAHIVANGDPECMRRSGSGESDFGLSLTKALVEANHAHFRIKSAPDAGTLIEIAFAPNRAAA
jgi:hypothetical protein